MSRPAHGRVVAAYGRHYGVRLDDGGIVEAQVRGKRGGLACGDRVTVDLLGSGQAVVSAIAPRGSLLSRADAFRTKLLAANADLMVAVVATEPSFSDELLTRCLVAACMQHIPALVALNKADLADTLPAARARLAPFAHAGFPVLELSALRDVAELRRHIQGRLSVFVGQSGMGKSTLLNALVPDAAAATQEISRALDTGRHTTTLSRLYAVDEETFVIDTPGMQEFGLTHLAPEDIEAGFPELAPYRGACRFRDSRHLSEPGCAVAAAVAEGAVSPVRLSHLHRLQAERQRAY